MSLKTEFRLILFIFVAVMFYIPICHGSSDWNTLQKNPERNAFQDPTYVGIGNFSTLSSMAISTTLPQYAYQSVAGDIDNDGSIEFIANSGNYIEIVRSGAAGLALEYEYLLGRPTITSPVLLDINGDSKLEIMTIRNNTIYTLYYNGSSINGTTMNASWGNGSNIVSGLACDAEGANYLCYFFNNSGYMFEYDAVSNALNTYNLGINFNLLAAQSYGRYFPPLITDYDEDGNTEIITACDPDNDGLEGMCIVIQPTGVLDAGFNGVGYLNDVSSTANTKFAGATAYNLDGAGGKEICVITGNPYAATIAINLNCFKTDGSAMGGSPKQIHPCVAGTCYPSAPFIAENTDNDGYYDICGLSFDSLNKQYISCFSAKSGSLAFVAGWNQTVNTPTPVPYDVYLPTTADMNSDGMSDIIISNVTFFNTFVNGKYVYNISYIMQSENSMYDSNAFPIDINGDDLLEICGSKSSNVWCLYSSYTNTPPDLFNNLTYGGYGSTCGYNTIPINTTVTFSALEHSNYDQDMDTDTERIATNCGQLASGSPATDYTTNLDNGTWSLSNPSFSCYFNVTGVYHVRLYLQDDKNTADYTEYNTNDILLNVMASGASCTATVPGDTDVIGAGAATGSESEINNAGTEFFDLMTGGNTLSKLLIAMILIIGIMVMAYHSSHNTLIAGLSGVIAMVFAMVFGLFPVWIFILLLITMLIVIILKYVLFRSPSQEG